MLLPEPGDRDDGHTEVVVEHTGHESSAHRDEHLEGWTHCLDRLVDHVAAP